MKSYCRICAGPIENPPDNHDHCIVCLGLAHMEAACGPWPLRGYSNVPLVGPPPPLESGDDNLARSHRSQRSPQSPVTFSNGCFRPPPSVTDYVSRRQRRTPCPFQPQRRKNGLDRSVTAPTVKDWYLTYWYFRSSRRQVDTRTSVPFFPDVHDQLVKTWSAPQSAHVHSATQAMFSQVDGAEAHVYVRMPPVKETIAAHLCPASAKTMGSDISLPSKPCRMTAHLANKAYSSAGQGASALHAMAVLQVFQAKLLQAMEGGTALPEAVDDLRAATDFALMVTKRAAQAIGRTMGFMVVQQRHLWLT